VDATGVVVCLLIAVEEEQVQKPYTKRVASDKGASCRCGSGKCYKLKLSCSEPLLRVIFRRIGMTWRYVKHCRELAKSNC